MSNQKPFNDRTQCNAIASGSHTSLPHPTTRDSLDTYAKRNWSQMWKRWMASTPVLSTVTTAARPPSMQRHGEPPRPMDSAQKKRGSMARAIPRARRKPRFHCCTRLIRGSSTRPNGPFGSFLPPERAAAFLGWFCMGTREEPAEASHSGWCAPSQLVEWNTGTPTCVHAQHSIGLKTGVLQSSALPSLSPSSLLRFCRRPIHLQVQHQNHETEFKMKIQK